MPFSNYETLCLHNTLHFLGEGAKAVEGRREVARRLEVSRKQDLPGSHYRREPVKGRPNICALSNMKPKMERKSENLVKNLSICNGTGVFHILFLSFASILHDYCCQAQPSFQSNFACRLRSALFFIYPVSAHPTQFGWLTNFFANERRPQFFPNGRQSQLFHKWKTSLLF